MSNFSKAFLVAGVFYAMGIAAVALIASDLLMESIGILIAFAAAVWLGAHNYFESRTPKETDPAEDSTGA